MGVLFMGKTVLVVDDDPTQRRLIQAVLERDGLSGAHADTGEQALERLVAARRSTSSCSTSSCRAWRATTP